MKYKLLKNTKLINYKTTQEETKMKFSKSSKPRLTPLVIGIGAAIAATTPTFAQQLEEVIVTAQFRSQSVQDVPIAITVLSEDAIEKASIFDATGIANNSPGLAYGEFSPGQAKYSMRGVGSSDDGAGLDNSVSLFLDGVYVGRGAGINFDLFDLERIEVLKGPQGALFGRNTIGGAISVVTQDPSDEFGGKASITAGNKGIARVQALVTGPLSEGLAGKLVVNHRQHDGFVKNVVTGTDNHQDEDQTSVRGQLQWERDNSVWKVTADHLTDDRGDAGRLPVANRIGRGTPVENSQSLGGGPFKTTAPIDGFTDREISGISLDGEIGISNGKLISITGFRAVESSWEMPSVGVSLSFGGDGPGVFGLDVVDDIDEEIDTFSQEFRFVSDFDGSVNVVGGLYYFTEDTDRTEQFRLDRNTVAGGQVTVGNEFTNTANKTTSFAAYGQAQWTINDKWTALLGARATKDEKEYSAQAVNCALGEAANAAAGFANFAPCQGVGGSVRIVAETFAVEAEDSWDDFSPMLSFQYAANENIMLFATASTGFKSGGFAGSQGVRSAATNPVDPESVKNLELGFKGDFLDNTLRLNATVYKMDYSDIQVVSFGPTPGSAFGTFQTLNAGEADISGIEIDFDWRITDQFSLSGNYAYLDTEVNDLFINGIDNSGARLSQSPENSYNLIADYVMPLGSDGGELNFNAQFTHVDEQTNTTTAESIINKSDEKDLLSASINWKSADEKYGVSVWGRNLTEEEYIAHTYTVGPGVIGIWGAPRTMGVTGTVNF